MLKPICIIPARKGSKRIKNKNVKNFFGKPIIFYSINTAKKSNLFKEIHVSTDSNKIKRIAKKFNVECDILRKKYLSSDSAKTFEVLKDFINNYINDEDEEFGFGSTFPQVICNGDKLGGSIETIKFLKEKQIIGG